MASKVRGILYIVAALLSLAFAIAIAFGLLTYDQVTGTVAVAVNLYLAFAAILARFNLTPDDAA